jgi:hypothetical protein
MPGNVEVFDAGRLGGWARHPARADYALTVHAVCAGRVVGTALADLARPDGMPGFAITLAGPPQHPAMEILIAETDERLARPSDAAPRPRRLTVEDLIATPVRRPWVTGACHLDALAAGMQPQTVIDLLCRDFLGRPAGPVVTATALAQLPEQGYDGVRRMLINSSEYKYRRIYAADAPGAIFSRPGILSAAAQDFTFDSQTAARLTEVSAAMLLEQETEAFVTACYRHILRKEPDRAGMAHYLGQLAAGVSKLAIIRHLSNEFETISAGIRIVDLPQAG